MTAPLIQFDCAAFSYGEGRRVLNGLTLEVAAGEFVVVVGPNGSGKSTLIRHINGLLTPQEGRVLVAGLDTADAKNLREIRRRVGMVFQNPESQSVASVVADEVAFGPENLGLPREEIAERVHQALEAVGMAGRQQDMVEELSGGQQQLIAIAGALAMRPEVLVLDEPASMLDAKGTAAVQAAIARAHEAGITIVMSTHDADVAAAVDRVVVLNDGVVAFDGTPGEVFSHVGELHALGLELPFRLEVEAAVADGRTFAPQPERASLGGWVELDDVSFAYSPDAPVLSDINYLVERGMITGIVGPTGAGKSTLLKLMNGLLVPTSGQVSVSDVTTRDRSNIKWIRKNVGLAFQRPEQQLFASTVLEDVAFGPRNLGFSKKEALVHAQQALDTVGLSAEEFGECSPFGLSGGQQRLAALAGVLAMKPEVLVLDEPTAGLDPTAAQAMRELILKLAREGRAIVLVTHSMDDAAVLCDTVLVVDGGTIALQGTPAEVFNEDNAPTLHGIGLQMPRAYQMAADRGLPPGILTFGQLVDALRQEVL